MIVEIEGILVSSEILTEHFCCDFEKCRGICCVVGDSGAPLTPREADLLKVDYDKYKGFMSDGGRRAIERREFFIKDSDGDIVTPLVERSGECAFSFTDNEECTFCAIEKYWFKAKSKGEPLPAIRKPISCHLYPIREKILSNGTIALNLSREHLCEAAFEKGKREGIPVYKFLKEALIFRFGEKFYSSVSEAASLIFSSEGSIPPPSSTL